MGETVEESATVQTGGGVESEGEVAVTAEGGVLVECGDWVALTWVGVLFRVGGFRSPPSSGMPFSLIFLGPRFRFFQSHNITLKAQTPVRKKDSSGGKCF